MYKVTVRFVHRETHTPVMEVEVAASTTVGVLRELLVGRLANEEHCMMRVFTKWHAEVVLAGGQKRLVELTAADEDEPLHSLGISHLSEVHLEGPLTGDSIEGLSQAVSLIWGQMQADFARSNALLLQLTKQTETNTALLGLLMNVDNAVNLLKDFNVLKDEAELADTYKAIHTEEGQAFARLQLLCDAEAAYHKVWAEATVEIENIHEVVFRIEFAEFYCSVVPADGWIASSDPSPMHTIGTITFKRPEFETMTKSEVPGAPPTVILTIEDVSVENLTVIELKEKSKTMTFQQIYQMSGGQFRPEVYLDTPEKNGVFEYTLEYSQSIPPFMDMRVSNLITIKNGLAYCFQLVANPQVFSQYKGAFIKMARSVEIAEAPERPFDQSPHVVNVISGISIKVPTSWSFTATGSQQAGERLVEFKSASETKTEMISIYKGDAQGIDSFKEDSSKEVDGVTVRTLKDGKKVRVVATHNGYSIVVAPIKISQSLMDPTTIAGVVKSISANEGTTSRRFVNTSDGYEVPVGAKGSLVCSKIGCGTVIYAPAGMEAMQNGEEAPTATLRVGNPNNDKSCASSLAEWRERLSSEDNIGDITSTTLAGLDAITFTSSEMTEVGPGMRSEVKSKVVIAILASGDTLLIRWECPTGPWRRYETQLNTLLKEIIIFNQ